MIKKIDRPNVTEFDKSMHLEYFEKSIGKIDKNLSSNRDISGRLFKKASNAVGSCIFLNLDSEKTLSVIFLVKDLGVAHFMNAQNPNKEITLKIGNYSIPRIGIETTTDIDPVFWSSCFYSAVVARDRSAIDYLRDVPESLMRKANIKCVESEFLMVKFLKGLFNLNIDLGQLLEEAILAIDPELNPTRKHEYLNTLKFPELDLYRLIFSESPEEFNKELIFALEQHKKFWTKGDLVNDPEGWISWPILCACIIAYEFKGFPIEVESDYLPLWLIERSNEK